MPPFARSGTGTWHIVGPDGCRYGRAFADDTEPEETVTATDIVAYEPQEAGALPLEADEQRLVLPETVGNDCCRSCRSALERHQTRRHTVFSDLKQVTTRRTVSWEQVETETPRACDWCRAHERTTYRSDTFRATVCPVCRRLFETGCGEPETPPDGDRLPETPSEPVTPILFGTERPDYEPAELVGSNRPVIKYREKHTYADVILELERTGHGLNADGIEALEAVRREYAARVEGSDTHRTSVTLAVTAHPRTATLEGILPADRAEIVDACWEVLRKPANWVPLGWPQQGYIHRRGVDPAVPGTDPVVETFPRLETRQQSAGVDTETLRSVTETGRYQRGQRYYERGAVTHIEYVDDQLEATVQGSRPYDVQATVADGSYVDGRCSCPDDMVPCKHLVAAVLASGDVEPIGGDRSLETLLEAASPEELRSLLRTLAENDVTVRKRLYNRLDE